MTRTVPSTGRWIRFPYRPPAAAAVRLFCLPYAGGNVMAFRDWIQASDERLEVAAVQLPGRGDRMAEAPYRRVAPLVAALREELLPHLDRPYALYGHSMGGHLALALARALRDVRRPEALFVGACVAPAAYRLAPPEVTGGDDALLAWLRRLGGTPEDVLADPQLLDLVLPPLRADLALLDDCRRQTGDPLPYPIHGYAGSRDPVAPPSTMDGWAAETTVGYARQVVAGGHLFLAGTGTAVLEMIRRQL
jgi:surfactin synthase thioesterase subunit